MDYRGATAPKNICMYILFTFLCLYIIQQPSTYVSKREFMGARKTTRGSFCWGGGFRVGIFLVQKHIYEMNSQSFRIQLGENEVKVLAETSTNNASFFLTCFLCITE